MTNTIEIKDAPGARTELDQAFKLSTTKLHRQAPKTIKGVLTGMWKPTEFSQQDFTDFLTTYSFHKVHKVGANIDEADAEKKAIDKAKSRAPAFCMATFENNVRRKDSVEQVLGFVFDYDCGLTIEEFKAAAKDCGLFYVLYETFTSSPDKEKFRAVFPFNDAVDFKTIPHWQSAHNGFAVQLGLPLTFDPTCWQNERLFFLASRPLGEDAGRTFVNNGVCVDPLTVEPVAVVRIASDGTVIEAVEREPLFLEVEGKEIDFRTYWNDRSAAPLADLIEQHAPDKIRKPRNFGGYEIECPFDHEHGNAGETDSATMADNANDKHEFSTVSCLHGSCEHRDTADFVHGMIKADWFDVSALGQSDDEKSTDFIQGLLDTAPETPPVQFYTKTEPLPSTMEMAEMLNGDSPLNDIFGVLKALTVEESQTLIADVLDKIKEKTKKNLGGLRKDLETFQTETIKRLEQSDKRKYYAKRRRILKAGGVNVDAPGVYTPKPASLKRDYISFADQDADMLKEGIDFPYLNSFGVPKPNIPNLILYLNKVGIEVYYEQFSNTHEIENYQVSGVQVPQSNEQRNSLRLLASENGVSYLKDAFKSYINELGAQNKRNTLLEEIEGFKWDGTPRLEKFWATYFGAEDTELNRAFAKCFFTALIKRVRSPGCKFDTLVVLFGKQGNEKSTGIATLASPKYFSEGIEVGCSSKEFMENATGIWINEYAEMSAFNKKDDGVMKKSLSTGTDRSRLAYAELSENRARSNVSIGTSNVTGLLKDMTGNRRYWPIDTTVVDIEGIKTDREQIIAEACQLEASGFSLVLPKELWEAAGEQQDKHMATNVMFDRISEFLQGTPDNKNEIPVIHSETLHSVVGIEHPAPYQSADITLIMEKHNWIKCEVAAEGDTFQKVYWRQDHYTWKRKPKAMKYVPYSDAPTFLLP